MKVNIAFLPGLTDAWLIGSVKQKPTHCNTVTAWPGQKEFSPDKFKETQFLGPSYPEIINTQFCWAFLIVQLSLAASQGVLKSQLTFNKNNDRTNGGNLSCSSSTSCPPTTWHSSASPSAPVRFLSGPGSRSKSEPKSDVGSSNPWLSKLLLEL